VIALDTPHHVTQRGNARQFILNTDPERLVYLDLLRHYSALHSLSVLGYCLMTNHVHLIVVPNQADSLATALKYTHGRYAAYWNAQHKSSGHVRQGRFYSCPLDQTQLWEALRYTELNPVRARMVLSPLEFRWSSAAVHCGQAESEWLDRKLWNQCWTAAEWRDYLAAEISEAELEGIRENTHTGRPLGSAEFIGKLERETGRPLAPQKGGRPRNTPIHRQPSFDF
jgi:putative transposase